MFGSLFKKGPEQLVKKAESYLSQGRFAEARIAFLDALEKLGPDAPEAASVRKGIADAGNSLALMNIDEAEHVLNVGGMDKAREHLELAIKLAEDVTIREKAEITLNSSFFQSEPAQAKIVSHACSSCGPHGAETHVSSESEAHELSLREQFELAVHTLPGDLPRRYLGMGEKFASGYLKSMDDDADGALSIYHELLQNGENDILLYECAVLHHRQGDNPKAEQMLLNALGLNPSNPLCRMTLVEFLAETGRYSEAASELEKMIEQDIQREQARLFLADIRQATGDITAAIDLYSQMLSTPLGKAAAERLVPLLDQSGRTGEAKALAKHFLKGCC
ncbi:MAG: tetratricopeptide repeat protein [Geobacter sp.]|nr:tetratricopeptide repeat protein [Geobacter sp.]